MSSFVPKYWLSWQIWWLFLINFTDKDGTTKVYIPVHPCLRASSAGLPYPRREVWSENEMDVDVQISYQQLEGNIQNLCLLNLTVLPILWPLDPRAQY